jgi:hypothetical protein
MKIALLGFVAVGAVLFTNHWGMAIRVTNYLYFFLLGLVIYEKVT